MKFEHTRIMNWEGAIRGMRNPLESWDKSDTKYFSYSADGDTFEVAADEDWDNIEIGEKDLHLMQNLIKAGVPDRKFMRQILVCVDITAPQYWWSQFDTYGVGVVKDSTSNKNRARKI